MSLLRTSSNILAPGGQLNPGSTSSGTTSTAETSLGHTMSSMRDVWPAADPTNGPLVSDSGIVAGTPTTTGKTFYSWQSGVFNTQSMFWQATPTGAGQNTSGYSACINASTSRLWNYSAMNGYPMESNHDFGWVTDSATVTIFYYHYNGYTGSNYHDNWIFAEHNGRMKSVGVGAGSIAAPLPTTSNGGAGLFYRTFTMKEMREIEWRAFLPAQAFFIGIYVDALATVRKSPNKFFAITNGDSWNEPNGNILANPVGGAYGAKGTFRCAGLSQMIAVGSGWAVGLMAQGGTGEYNVNDGAAHDLSYTLSGVTAFHGPRIDDAWTKFGARSPMIWTIGGWNDGTLPGAPYAANYQARVTAGIDKWIGKRSDIKLLYSGIQPVGIGAGDSRDLSMNGQAAACASRTANVIGFMDLRPMWLDTTTSGQRGANTNSSDTIHLTAKGSEQVANWMLAQAKTMRIPTSYYNAMLAA